MQTKQPPKIKEWFFGALMFAGAGFIILILSEIVLRFISPPSVFSPRLPLRPLTRMELHTNLRGVSPVTTYSTNRWGFRGDEPPSAWKEYHTLLAIGGSTTQCFYLDDRKTWPFLFQKRLEKDHPKVWVGNGGLSGHSTRGNILFMDKVIPKIKPEMVLLLVGANDLAISINEGGKLRNHPEDPAASQRGQHSILTTPLAHSRLVQILYLWKKVLLDKVVVDHTSRHSNFAMVPLTVPETPLPEDLRELLPQLDEFRENLKKIIQQARSHHVKIVLMTQPYLFEDTPDWEKIRGSYYWTNETDKFVLSGATFWKLLNIYNQTTLEVCRSEQIPCYDLASAIPHRPTYFYDEVHFTERGAKLVAARTAEFFKANHLLDFEVAIPGSQEG